MSRRADTAARSSIRAKPAVVNGEPRSETNMNGDAGASRWRRRRALISRPVWGWALGVLHAPGEVLPSGQPRIEHRTGSRAFVVLSSVPCLSLSLE